MTVNRRWLAREWLFLLACAVGGFLLMFLPLLHVYVFIPLWFPYVLFQTIRATVWAIRTLRETVE